MYRHKHATHTVYVEYLIRQIDLETNYGGKKVTSEEKLLGIISLAYIDAIEKLERQALLV